MPLHNPPAGQIPTRVLYVTVIMRITASINETTDAGMIAARTIMPC